MSDTLIVLKPARFRRIPWKNWFLMLGLFALSVFFLIGCFSIQRLTKENTRELIAPISSSRVVTRYSGRNSRSTAIVVIEGESCTIPIRNRELRQLMENHPTGVARVIVTEDGSIAELEYDGTLYHTLEKENTRRMIGRFLALITGLLLLAGGLFFLWVDLLSYTIVILRKRPKNMEKSILIEK